MIYSYITLFCLISSVFSFIGRSTIPYSPQYISNNSNEMISIAFPCQPTFQKAFCLTYFGEIEKEPRMSFLRDEDSSFKCYVMHLSCVSAQQRIEIKCTQLHLIIIIIIMMIIIVIIIEQQLLAQLLTSDFEQSTCLTLCLLQSISSATQ